ncbi:MAG TPA: S49 family peptidase [Candidatus Moranbacteria bacterium]|nr:S49 family peptidase [Candidatus Moranbacteria bacterium]
MYRTSIKNKVKYNVSTVIPTNEENWERDILNRLAFAALNEQRRARRWRIFFMFLTFLYLFLIYLAIMAPEWQISGETIGNNKHTAIVEIKGVISSETEASADNVISNLRDAFEHKSTAGVIIRINSPGGSPVQAGYINDEIIRLKEKYPEIPLYAVTTDICASGGYYIAVAADKIYADKASIVGSIGVLMSSFGFVGAMEKLGIERRLLTAGEHKGFLDPFSPTKEEDIAHVKTALDNIHNQFIEVVKKGRGKRLQNADESQIFSGLVWTGEQAVEMGLVDGLGSSSYVAREIIKAEKLKNFTSKPNYLDQFAKQLGTSMTESMQFLLNSTIR